MAFNQELEALTQAFSGSLFLNLYHIKLLLLHIFFIFNIDFNIHAQLMIFDELMM